MSEKVIHSFEGTCPLTHYGIYGIKKSFNMPNFPCREKAEHISLKKHLMYAHNLSNTAANKIVLVCMTPCHSNRKKKSPLVFHSTQELFSHSVHWHKGQCPFSYGFSNVYNLTQSNHQIKNFDCRHRKQCLLLSHLRVSHNLNIKAAKKIVKAIMASSIESKQQSSIENDIQEIVLFQEDDVVSNSNPNVYNDDRRFRHYCPLTKNEFTHEQPLFNIPCMKINEKFLLFAHLQHYHQMSGELALRLIRIIRTGSEPVLTSDLFQTCLSQSSTHTATPLSSSSSSQSKTAAPTDEIDIVPYKCLCPYSNDSTDRTLTPLKTRLKKFAKFVQNVPCDRPCPVNLYRHLRNYHKVDLQHAKDITRTIMSAKSIRGDGLTPTRKAIKASNRQTDCEPVIPLGIVHMDLPSVKIDDKIQTIDYCLGDENPDEWDASMMNDEDSLFLAFEQDRFDPTHIESSF